MKDLICFNEECLNDKHYQFVVNGCIVGECNVCHDNYIYDLRVDEEFQNKGYAKEMLKAIMKLFSGQRMWLRTYTTNIPAIKAYTKVGFTTFKHEDCYYEKKHYDISHMEMIAPVNKNKFIAHYAICDTDGNRWIFDSETDRNEMLLAFYQERVYDLWNHTINWSEVPEEEYKWELEGVLNEVQDVFSIYEVIHIEE
jgi:hypothetical protein